MEKEETVRYKIPILDKEKLWKEGNLFFLVLVGCLLLAISFVAFLEFDLKGNFLIGFLILMGIFYMIIILFTLEPKILREITIKDVREVQKKVVKEVPKQIIYETDRTIYVTNPRKKLNIHKYKFIGSSETKIYHKKSCRFGKLIKKKYKVLNDSEVYFKVRGYKKCKVCLGKNKSKT